MAQHIDQLPLFCLLRKNFMERVELFGADFSIKYGDRKIRPVDTWIFMIILIQVRLWPVNIYKKKVKQKSTNSAAVQDKTCLTSTYIDQVFLFYM